jgi:hypothetical protein
MICPRCKYDSEELPHQTFERILGVKWNNESRTLERFLFHVFCIRHHLNSSAGNMELQQHLLANERQMSRANETPRF